MFAKGDDTNCSSVEQIADGETFYDALEFVTENGKEEIQCTWYKTRSIVLGIVRCKDVK